MSARCWLAGLIVLGGPLTLPATADEPKAPALAKRLWAVTDVVLDHHVSPPSRQEMLLAALRVLTLRSQPDNLARRVSAVTTEEQLAQLLDELKATADGVPEYGIINSLLTAVPGQPPLLPPGNLRAIEQVSENRYVGTGIQVRMHDQEKLVQILVPFPGGPAKKAGAKPNDLIVSIDGAEMKGKSLQEVVDTLRGDEGSKLSVVVRQPGEKESRTLNMVRSVVPFESAVGCRRSGEESWDFRPDNSEPIAYVRFLNLTVSTPSELTKLEPRLRDEGVKAVVLDLRSAGAGQFRPVLLLADLLLDGGVIWKAKDGRGQVKEYKADRECVFRGWPMAVLVNSETDPMVTLLAAALQDAGRAVVVGETPRESGWVTSLVKLPDGLGGVMLRTGLVERSPRSPRSERPVRLADAIAGGWVLQPDHEVGLTKAQKQAIWDFQAAQERQTLDAGKMPEDQQLARARTLLMEALKAPSRN